VDWEQDSEDPSQVEIDMDSVQEAVEDLADRKKHLIGTPGEGKPKSGGKFKRKQNSSDDGDASKQVLLENYPSLR
jgi:single-stranded DNA-binding protein